MSNRLSSETRREQLRLPPVETQIAIALLAAMFGLLVMQFDQLGVRPLLMLTVLFVGGVWSRRAWLFWLLFGLLVYLKYFLFEPGNQFGVRGLRGADFIVATLLMLLAASCFRFLEVGRYLDTFYPNTNLGDKPPPGVRFEFPSLLGGRWCAIPVAVVVSSLLLGLPFNGPAIRQFRFRPTTARLVFLILFLFFAWYVIRAIVGMIVRRRMKPDQADVHCRSLIANEFWKETYGIEKRRAKHQSDS